MVSYPSEITMNIFERDSDCFSKYLFAWKCIKIIFFFKKIFLILVYQNNLKIQENN